MSIPDIGGSSATDASVKTLGIRLKGRLHSQVVLVAQLRGTSINDEVVEALDAHVNRITADPAWAAKARQLRDAIRQRAAAEEQAFSSLFGPSSDEVPAEEAEQSAAPEAKPAARGRTAR